MAEWSVNQTAYFEGRLLVFSIISRFVVFEPLIYNRVLRDLNLYDSKVDDLLCTQNLLNCKTST